MAKTFQSYLTCWYCIITGCSFIVFSSALYLKISSYLYDNTDSSLLHLAHIEAGAALELDSYYSINNDDGEPPHIHESPLQENVLWEQELQDRLVHIFSLTGEQLDSSTDSTQAALPTDQAILNTFVETKQKNLVYKTISSSIGKVRTLYMPIVLSGTITNYIQVGISLSNTILLQRKLQLLLVVLNGIVISLSFIVGHFFSKRALEPMNQICSTAVKITATNLKERLHLASSFLEIKQLTSIFNDMLSRIEHSLNTQKQFIADASHEIQSPLTILKGTMEVALRRERNPEEYKTTLTESLEETDRISHLVTNLLALTTLDSEKILLQKEPVNLYDLASDIIIMQHNAAAKNVTLAITGENTVIGLCEKNKIRQVISNLIDNAIKYTLQKSVVTVRVYKERSKACIAVEDNGIGIAKDDQPHLFNRFFRVDKSRSRDTGGTGLGLAIVKEIIDLHSGKIIIESEPGKGSTFTIKLQAAPTLLLQ